ncbi:MAG: prenyltransferase [Moraxellaceae bacterium]|nr:prenyltransferase [Moraxellaceae bacterium]
MTTAQLSLQDAWPRRFLAWINQRFPFSHALLFFILYLTAAAIVRASNNDSILQWHDVMGCVITWSFFLVLRIFDEHKDYELDCQNHPQRVLQSGLITLNHLKIVAACAISLQVGYAIYVDGGLGATFVAWLMMFAWTCLMGKEFFIADWLTRHLTWYAVSHMMVMPLIVWWLANMALPHTALSLPLQALMSLAFISGFCFEITRKTKGPEERDTIESYSRIFGTRGSAVVVMGLLTVMVANQTFLITQLSSSFPIWAGAILAVFYGLGMMQLAKFIQAPSIKGREKNEAVIAFTMLVGYAVLIAVVISSHSAPTL